MSVRLPVSGSDGGDWGDILNSFLQVSLYNNINNGSDPNNGTLNSNTVGSSQIQNGAVGTSQLANNSITNAQLDIPTQTSIASISSKYVKPPNGIPLSDLSTGVQADLTAATEAVQIGGDLGGTTTSPTIAKLQGITLTAGTPANNQVLTYSSSGSGEWIPATVTSTTVNNATASAPGIIQLDGDLGGSATNPTVPSASGLRTTTTSVNVASATAPSAGQVLTATSSTAASWVSPANGAGDATSSTPGIIQLNGDLGGSATSPVVETIGGQTPVTESTSLGGDLSGNLPSPTLANTSNVQNIVNAILDSNSTLADAVQESSLGISGGVATLNSNSELTSSQIPSLVITASSSPVEVSGVSWVFNVRDGAYGAKGDGATDDTNALIEAINAASSAGGGIVYMPPGTYLISSTLNLSQPKVIMQGSGIASTIQPSASFSGSQIINITADFCGIRDLHIAYENTVYSDNPAADCIVMQPSYNFIHRNLVIEYINGYGMTIIGQNGNFIANGWSTVDGVTIKESKQGIGIFGYDASSPVLGLSFSNTTVTGAKDGPGLYMQDTAECKFTNMDIGLDSGSDAAIHINGACSSLEISNSFFGCTTPTTSGPTALLETGTHGTPKNINFTNCDFQQGLYGIEITDATQSNFTSCSFNNNGSHNIYITNGDGLVFHSCDFQNDGSYGRIGTPTYDIYSSSPGQNIITNCLFLTSIGTGVGEVTYHINITSGYHIVSNCNFKNGNVFAPGGSAQIIGQNLGYNDVLMIDGTNVELGNSSGTQWGTDPTQKQAFYGSTPVTQPSTSGITEGFTNGTGTNITDDATFTGNIGSEAYTLGDIVNALKQLGLIQS